jgi:hypothetical protein
VAGGGYGASYAGLPRCRCRVSPGFQSNNLAFGLCWKGHRPPSRNDPHAFPPSGVVGDEREMPPQFDDRGQLAFLVESTTNRLGGNFIDTEHGINMRRRPGTGK